MVSIERLLHRRSDLSTFLVHLTRPSAGDEARDNLLSIVRTRTIEARRALGMAAHLEPHLRGTSVSQSVVCFTETPVEHVWMMTEQIDGRGIQFGKYGLVFTKTTARRKRCNPVWYIDITPGHDWLTGPINKMVDEAIAAATRSGSDAPDLLQLAKQPIFEITPFLEQMGPTNTGRKEFWWEREWRCVGDFQFVGKQVVALLAPQSDHAAIEDEIRAFSGSWARRVPPLLDPDWGQERMIGSMSGIDDEQLGPFPGAVT